MAETGATPQGQPSGFYKKLCERFPAALVATDLDLNVVCWNAAAGRLLGQSAQQMLGQPLASIAGAKRQVVLARLLQRTLRDGQTREFDVDLTGPGGDEVHLLVVVGSVPSGDGSPQGVAAWVRDVTSRHQMAERLAAAEKLASLGTLASGVAHHFNNILGGVATYVDFALTNNDPAAARRALQMTAEATSRVAKITQSLLSFAEQDSLRHDLADLTEVVLTFSHLAELPLGERNIKLALDLHRVPIVPVEANRMHQVLGNLLTNSEEAMPSGGEIRLTIDCDEEWVWLDFADTGCGIPPDHLPLVFEPFFTTKGLLAGGNSGNPGLGLSVAHGIVAEMGGQISAASEPGHGASFRIRFPRPDPDAP
jgi:PAS domain S-box-containing protein